MRIAWVLYGSLEQRTGGTIYDAQVVAALRRAGDDVLVLSLEQEGPSLPRGFALTLPPLARVATTAKAGLSLARRIEAIEPDVVVGDELCFAELAVAFRMLGARATSRTVRRVLLVHHLTAWEAELAPLRRRAMRAGERLCIDASDMVVTTSHATRDRLVREGVREAIDVVLPGADRLARYGAGAASERSPRPELGGDEAVTFVFVGAVTPRKRVLEAVRALGHATRAGAGTCAGASRLVLVGSTERDAAYVAQVRATIRELGLGDRVTVTGELGEDGVAQALAGAHALVMPSTLEGYGIAATEAIHAGVPVIAARAQGLEEALASCPDARLFADDEASLARAMERFTSDAVLRRSMIDAARSAAARMPTWAACAQRFRELLREVSRGA